MRKAFMDLLVSSSSNEKECWNLILFSYDHSVFIANSNTSRKSSRITCNTLHAHCIGNLGNIDKDKSIFKWSIMTTTAEFHVCAFHHVV